MLEARNLVKVYRPKRGVPCYALNDVSIKLPSRGMVFLLGKSGAGKSTLLNVLGGLDSFDSGEILIKGKSTTGFKQAEFDSYRNTYVGFIFQEYNILNEFTVGANIGLAMELQGKKADEDTINRILNEVDLEGLGNRKPNELSGGQKQRVAIARALIKNPEIIMADEPTGALDSNTGKQVFDTLKKLSETKLVLIVSHDREFAEGYADRIVELSDGKIISDVSIEHKEVIEQEENVVFENDEISVKQGYKLTQDDLDQINAYLESHSIKITSKNKKTGDLIIKDTDESKIDMNNDGFKLIKSKLSIKNSYKIGSTGLRHKKVRLLFTILLSLQAFTLFGLSDTLASYNKIDATVNSISDAHLEYASFTKGTSSYDTMKLSTKDIKEIEENTNVSLKGVYNGRNSLSFGNNVTLDYSNAGDRILSSTPVGYVEFSENDLKSYGYELIGQFPNGSLNEIAITDYSFEYFKSNGYHENKSEDIKQIRKNEDMIGKTISFESGDYIVTGIVDTKFDFDRFKILNEEVTSNVDVITNLIYQLELDNIKQYSLVNSIIVGEGFVNTLAEKEKSILSQINPNYSLTFVKDDLPSEFKDNLWFDSFKCRDLKIADIIDVNQDDVIWLKSYNTLGNNELLLSSRCLHELIDRTYGGLNVSIASISLTKYDCSLSFKGNTISSTLNEYIGSQDFEIWEKMYSIGDYAASYYLSNHVSEYEHLDSIEHALGEIKYSSKTSGIIEKIKLDIIIGLLQEIDSVPRTIRFTDYKTKQEIIYTIVGFISNNESSDNNFLVFNQEGYSNIDIVEDKDAIYSSAVGVMPKDKASIRKIVKYGFSGKEDEVHYSLENAVTYQVELVDSILLVLRRIFVIVGSVFIAFATLLFSTFIASSVSYKKREIGILRAIGSRTSDVFKIFFAEASIIAAFNFVISCILTGIGSVGLNSVIKNETGFLISIANFGFRQICILFLIAFAAAGIATFLPVLKYAKKKPIDSIKSL